MLYSGFFGLISLHLIALQALTLLQVAKAALASAFSSLTGPHLIALQALTLLQVAKAALRFNLCPNCREANDRSSSMPGDILVLSLRKGLYFSY